MFFTIFSDLCAKKNKTPTAVGNEIGIAKTTISYWRKKQDILPKPEVLSKLSEYFGVPVSYFLGETEIKNTPDELQLTEGEKMLLNLFRQIPEERQQAFLEMGRLYSDSLK